MGSTAMGSTRVFRLGLGDPFVEVGERQLELLQLIAQLLRRAAERDAQRPGEPRPQRLDLVALLEQSGPCRGEFCPLRRHLGCLRRQHRPQGGDVARQAVRIDRHTHRVPHGAASRQAKPALRPSLPVAMSAPALASRCPPSASPTAPV